MLGSTHDDVFRFVGRDIHKSLSLSLAEAAAPKLDIPYSCRAWIIVSRLDGWM